MLWVSLGIVTVFGGATLLLHDETFIKWKPTVLYWLFAGILFGSLVLGKNPMQAMLGQQLTLPAPVWLRLNQMWGAFFAVMGVLNLYIAYQFPTDIWVNFKLFGGMGLMLLFVIGQGFYLSRYLEEPAVPASDATSPQSSESNP
jgi:intracellular septation protein